MEVLEIANQLNGVAVIQAATLNFVQTIAYDTLPAAAAPQPTVGPALNDLLAALPDVITPLIPPTCGRCSGTSTVRHNGDRSRPAQTFKRRKRGPISRQGDGVTVAVIDSLIQWDHPDLPGNLAAIAPEDPNRLPGEVHGWDFSSEAVVCLDQAETDCVTGDPDTRISNP